MDDEKRVTLRLPAGLHARLADLARADRRSLNSEIVHLLESAVEAAPPRGGPDSSPA
jgi:predicted HicB family RNase H-like nuclease